MIKNEKQSLFGMPSRVSFCSKCVISNQRPSSVIEFKNSNQDKSGIHIGSDSICSACEYHRTKESQIDWTKREEQLLALLDLHRSKNNEYDVIVPGSGGKDSAFTAHILKYKYNMNPLTVTWAPHLYTKIGWENFQNWMHVGGLDNILYTPNGRLHRELTKNAFLNLLHPFQPFIIGQRLIGPRLADKFGVKLVFYGENQAEYGNSIEENSSPTMSKSFFSHSANSDLLLGGIALSKYLDDGKFTEADFLPYLPFDREFNEVKAIDVHYLGYYVKWDPQECFYYAAENTGFKAAVNRTEGTYSRYSSIDDKIDPFHYYTTLIKFGIGRCTYDAAQEIRTGKIARAEGIHLVEKYDQEFPSKYFNEFLDYIDISEEQFHETVDRFRSPHLWHQGDDEKWSLRHTVGGRGIDD